MAVSEGYREFVLEQIGRVVPVTSRRMFGGVGLYAAGLFFGLIDDDVLYFKTDEITRGDFIAAGMEPFRPFEDPAYVMSYYQVPEEALEETEALRAWLERALAAARRARAGKEGKLRRRSGKATARKTGAGASRGKPGSPRRSRRSPSTGAAPPARRRASRRGRK